MSSALHGLRGLWFELDYGSFSGMNLPIIMMLSLRTDEFRLLRQGSCLECICIASDHPSIIHYVPKPHRLFRCHQVVPVAALLA